jgi:hypothetical protein
MLITTLEMRLEYNFTSLEVNFKIYFLSLSLSLSL